MHFPIENGGSFHRFLLTFTRPGILKVDEGWSLPGWNHLTILEVKKIGDSIKIDPEISVGNFLLGLIQMSVFKKTISDIPSHINQPCYDLFQSASITYPIGIPNVLHCDLRAYGMQRQFLPGNVLRTESACRRCPVGSSWKPTEQTCDFLSVGGTKSIIINVINNHDSSWMIEWSIIMNITHYPNIPISHY